MKLNRFLAAASLPILIAGCIIPTGQAFSQNASRRSLAQNSTQPGAPQGQRRPPRQIDFATAAAKLGVSEAQLKDALGVNNADGQKQRPDIQGAATKLGVTEQQLVQALGLPQRPPGHNFAEAASQLGVTETQLKEALGIPNSPPNPGDRAQRPPRPDFEAAAAKLGVTEQRLVEVLRIPTRPHSGERPVNP
uniref:Uncharacterized protein n=1 Tax=Oscillatoriales cyanobacterium SpSt-402 TaxID=2282168 RepID=A0A832H380_9CYAN